MEERIIQFGTGKFLRGFFDWMISILNDTTIYNGKVVMVQSTNGDNCKNILKVNCTYNVFTNGIFNGDLVEEKYEVNAISRVLNANNQWIEILKCAENINVNCIVSNTTESGIVYDESDTMDKHKTFPSKITVYLYNRYKCFKGMKGSEMIIIPCELVSKNGDLLKKYVLEYSNKWGLEECFKQWVDSECVFFNTLVDSIVAEEKDNMSVVREPFYVWYIEGEKDIFDYIPFDKCNLNVKQVLEITKYRDIKVRILNCIHTSLVCTAYLKGFNTVRDALENEEIKKFIDNLILNEVIPTLPYEEKELKDYYYETIERFINPFINHKLEDISLNSSSKFYQRIFPSIIEYKNKFKKDPIALMKIFEGFLTLYKVKSVKDDELFKAKILQINSFEKYLEII